MSLFLGMTTIFEVVSGFVVLRTLHTMTPETLSLTLPMKHVDNCSTLSLPAIQTCSESSSQFKTSSDVQATVADCMFSDILKSLKYSLRDHQFLCVKQEHNQIHSLLKS